MSKLLKAIAENAGFVAVMAAVAAGVCLIAWLAQKFWGKDMQKKNPILRLTVTAMMSASAFILMFFEIPLPFAPPFYKLDFSEVPILICAFACGPVSGVLAEFLKILIKLLIRGTSTAFVGEFANFVIGCSFILPAAVIYAAKKTRIRALIGCVAGTLVITAVGSLFNAFYLLPAFAKLYGMELDAIIGMGAALHRGISDFSLNDFVLWCVAPLNLVKGAVVSAIVMLIYKPISRVINRLGR